MGDLHPDAGNRDDVSLVNVRNHGHHLPPLELVYMQGAYGCVTYVYQADDRGDKSQRSENEEADDADFLDPLHLETQHNWDRQ